MIMFYDTGRIMSDLVMTCNGLSFFFFFFFFFFYYIYPFNDFHHNINHSNYSNERMFYLYLFSQRSRSPMAAPPAPGYPPYSREHGHRDVGPSRGGDYHYNRDYPPEPYRAAPLPPPPMMDYPRDHRDYRPIEPPHHSHSHSGYRDVGRDYRGGDMGGREFRDVGRGGDYGRDYGRDVRDYGRDQSRDYGRGDFRSDVRRG